MPVLVCPTAAVAAVLAVSDLHCSSPSQHTTYCHQTMHLHSIINQSTNGSFAFAAKMLIIHKKYEKIAMNNIQIAESHMNSEDTGHMFL